MKWLITGATGVVGSEIALRLLAAGDQVFVIIREASGDLSRATARAEARLGGAHQGLFVVVGDVCKENCGLSREDLLALEASGIDGFVHGAADLAYHGQNTLRTNMLGTENAIALARRVRAKHFVFLSTAYVSGSLLRFLETDVGSADLSQNLYDISKIAGEEMVRNAWTHPIILRISIMVGDSVTGHVNGFNGYYGFLGGIALFRRAAQPYRRTPIYLGVDASTGRGVRPDSTLNLVPREWCVDMMGLVFDDLRAGRTVATHLGTFHITHPRPAPIGWLVETSCQILGVPVTCSPPAQEPGHGWRLLSERVRKRAVDPFGHYAQTPVDFGSNKHLRQLPGYREPPDIDEDVLRRLIAYAVKARFIRAPESAPRLVESEVTAE
jgi:nucleoside-diphosphate-sugar epimerase